MERNLSGKRIAILATDGFGQVELEKNPDRLRTNPEAVEFVRAFAKRGKPIAAICHAPCGVIFTFAGLE